MMKVILRSTAESLFQATRYWADRLVDRVLHRSTMRAEKKNSARLQLDDSLATVCVMTCPFKGYKNLENNYGDIRSGI